MITRRIPSGVSITARPGWARSAARAAAIWFGVFEVSGGFHGSRTSSHPLSSTTSCSSTSGGRLVLGRAFAQLEDLLEIDPPVAALDDMNLGLLQPRAGEHDAAGEQVGQQVGHT